MRCIQHKADKQVQRGGGGGGVEVFGAKFSGRNFVPWDLFNTRKGLGTDSQEDQFGHSSLSLFFSPFSLNSRFSFAPFYLFSPPSPIPSTRYNWPSDLAPEFSHFIYTAWPPLYSRFSTSLCKRHQFLTLLNLNGNFSMRARFVFYSFYEKRGKLQKKKLLPHFLIKNKKKPHTCHSSDDVKTRRQHELYSKWQAWQNNLGHIRHNTPDEHVMCAR